MSETKSHLAEYADWKAPNNSVEPGDVPPPADFTEEEKGLISGMSEDGRELFGFMSRKEQQRELADHRKFREQLNSPDLKMTDRAPELLGLNEDETGKILHQYREIAHDYNLQGATQRIADLLRRLEGELQHATSELERNQIRARYITEFKRDDL
jgi:hypothetical protein